jgi:HK97 family phage portal protein
MAAHQSWLRKAVAWTRVLSIREPQHWRSDNSSSAGEAVTEKALLGFATAWACVNLLAGTLASLSVEVKGPGSSGGVETVTSHQLHRLLHESPNADQTAYEFWEFAVAALELRGNFHARISRAGARIVALTPILAEVTARRTDTGAIRYRWTEDGIAYDEPQENVFHVRGFGGSPLAGLSTLTIGRTTFGLAIATQRAASTTFENGLRPSGVLTFANFLKREQRQELEERLQQKFAGAMNAGRPMLLEGGTKWEQLTISPEDAQMLESRAFSVEEVCRFFGVPPFMVGHTEKTTSFGTGLAEQVLGFQKFSLRRRTKRIEQAIRKQLMTPADRAAGLKAKFNFEDLLRGDPGSRSAFYNAGLANGWLTINEVRALEGLPPVEGGDVPRMQMQNVPITQAAGIGHNGGPPLPAA